MNPVVNVVQHVGILDATTSEDFREKVIHSLSPQPDIILLDLAQTSFIDSSGLGAIVSAMKQVRAKSVEFYVCSPNEQVKIVFDLSSMDRAFKVFDSRDSFDREVLQNV